MLLILLLGCGPAEKTGLEGIEATAARLLDVELATVAFLGGSIDGRATLEIDTPAGDVVTVPVDLDGGTFGMSMEFSADEDFGIPAELDLSEAGAPLPANDLLGSYDGTGGGFVMIAGIDTHELRNPAGVRLDRDWFALGFGVFVGIEWLRVEVDGAVLGADEDEGTPDTGPDTGDAGDTGGPGD